MLLLICVVQIVITLIDYQFNAMVEATFPETDARTAAIGRVYAAIDATSIALQLLTGPILKLAGVSATLMAIPVLLGAAVTSFAAGPRLATIAIAKVAGKAFDYSLFRAAKELLYLPLSYAEKTQGKALVDILAYRVAKAGASLLLMALVAVEAVFATTFIALGAIAVWVALSVVLTRRYARLVRGGAAATAPP
jgi:AAA family ATP:ADP antiporter